MSVSTESEDIVSLRPETVPVQAAPAAESAEVARQKRPGRSAWIAPLVIAAVGLVVAGMLGYMLYATLQQRDDARHQLANTKTSLAVTRDQLSAAQSDAAARKVTADYVALYIVDEGQVETDYFNFVNCKAYSDCRTAAQQMLTDMQKFQADRKAAKVPFSLEGADNSLGDALSAGIAADQEMILGIDNGDVNKARDGGTKLDAAMLSLTKAQLALGSVLR